MIAKLIGVGVGPGDPELLTLAAVRHVREAECLAYVINREGKSFARDVVAEYIPQAIEELPLLFSMSPDIEERRASRAQAAEKVLAVLGKGKNLTFITEGDPLLYSTFQHLLASMPEDVEIDIVPGIMAFNSAAANSAFSLVVENETLMVSSGLRELNQLPEWLAKGKTVVLYKVFTAIPEIKKVLSNIHPVPQAVLLENASTENERIHRDWQSWPEALPYFSIALIRPGRIDA